MHTKVLKNMGFEEIQLKRLLGMATQVRFAKAAAVGCVLVVGLSACQKGEEGGKATQSLVSVNGKEITVHQLNEELERANVQPAQREAATKQLLQALVDRQLLESAALKAKVDRDPNVMRAIERAKSQIIAQAYLQARVANVAKPDKSEVEAFYKQNPQLFSARKLVEMEQLLLDSRYITEEFKSAMGGFKTLQDVGAWLDAKGIQYDRGQVARSVAELPPQISERLKDARRGQLFVIGMGPRTMMVLMDSIKDSPVSLADATPAIEQNLQNKKRKELGESEIAKLRSEAKIDYKDKDFAEQAPKEIKSDKKTNSTQSEIDKGAGGLK